MNPEELREEIAIEFEALDLIVDELNQLLDDFRDTEPPIPEKTAAGAFLAQFYNGIENILKRYYKFSGGTLPEGYDWHIALFKPFATHPGKTFLYSSQMSSQHNWLRLDASDMSCITVMVFKLSGAVSNRVLKQSGRSIFNSSKP